MTLTATVLLPVYNAENYLAESLESLRSQTYRNFEILAVDDGSSDGSPQILYEFAKKEPRLRILTLEQNLGLVSALNRGLADSRTDLIFRQDADDRAHSERVERSIAYLEQRPEVVLLGSAIARIRDDGSPAGLQKFPLTDPELRWQLLFRNPFAHSAVVFRRAEAVACGGYSPIAKHAEDYDLWTRLAKHGQLANLSEALCDYRVHGGNVSLLHATEMIENAARIGAKWLKNLCEDFPGARAFREGAAWEKFCSREAMTSEEYVGMLRAVSEVANRHPDLHAYPERAVREDIAWHLVSYLRKQPRILKSASVLGETSKWIAHWRSSTASRWRST